MAYDHWLMDAPEELGQHVPMRRLSMIECGYIWRAGGLRLRCGLLLWCMGLHRLAVRVSGVDRL